MKTKLLSNGSTNAKTAKSQKVSKSFIMYLAPHKQNSYGKNVCGHASPGCAEACLYTAGRGKFSTVQQARIRKTDMFMSDAAAFLTELYAELKNINSWAVIAKSPVAVRLNGTSDLDFIELINRRLNVDVLSELTNLQFYDYTKNLSRAMKYLGSRYHLTFSRSEVNNSECMQYLIEGGNVAMVFDKVPSTFMGFTVIDGDESDLRYMDEQNVIVGLKAKGDAKKDTSGFVIKKS